MASIKKRTSIVILLDHIDGMEELSDREFGRVIRDYAEYVKNGTEPEYKTPYKRLIWKNIKNFDALNVTKMEARKEAIERYKEKQKRENASKNTQNENQSDSSDISDIKNISDDSVSVSSSVSDTVSVSSSVSSSSSVSVSVSESVSESVDRDTKESMSNDIPKKAAKPKTDPFVEFAGEDKELLKQLRAFAEMRTKKHKPMTDKAKKRLCNKLDSEFQPCEWMEVLEQSIYHSWDDVYELRDKNQSQSQSQARNTGSELDDQFARVAGMIGADW